MAASEYFGIAAFDVIQFCAIENLSAVIPLLRLMWNVALT